LILLLAILALPLLGWALTRLPTRASRRALVALSLPLALACVTAVSLIALRGDLVLLPIFFESLYASVLWLVGVGIALVERRLHSRS